MKRNAIVRIIAYSLTVLILASVMGAVIGTNGSIFSGFFINIPNSDEDKYIQAQSAVEIKDSLTKVEIVWLSGIVNISYGDSLKFSEDKKDDAEPLMYTFDGEKLKINSHKRVQKMGLPSLTKAFETKNLNITLPKSIRELDVEEEKGNHELGAVGPIPVLQRYHTN